MGIKDNYILHEMNGEYVIIEINDGALEFSHVFYINSSAADMFRLMKDGLNKDAIITKMLEEYDTTTLYKEYVVNQSQIKTTTYRTKWIFLTTYFALILILEHYQMERYP